MSATQGFEIYKDPYESQDQFIDRLKAIDQQDKATLDKAQVLHAVYQLILIDALDYHDDKAFMSSWTFFVGELLLSRGRRVKRDELIEICLEITADLEEAIQLALMIIDLWTAEIFVKLKPDKKYFR